MEYELISVIIPVYNTEKYLHRCVASIVNQSYKSLEIILVNDGSTDSSPAICDELAVKDSRIKVIHQQNDGHSIARNVGIANATGSYIAFVDSDDYVHQDYIHHLYDLINEYHADISITNYIKEYEKNNRQAGKNSSPPYTLVMDRHEAMEIFLYQRHFTTAIWGRLFHKSLFNGVAFPIGMTAQDVGVMYRLIDKASRVVYKSIPDYIYFQHASSTVYSRKRDRERDSIILSEEMREFITKQYSDLERAAISRCFSTNILALMDMPMKGLYHKEHVTVIENIRKYRLNVLTNPKARIKNRGCALISYLGIWVLKISLDVFSKGKP